MTFKLDPNAKITFASRKLVESIQPELDLVLAALGYPEAFTTDESMVCDFGLPPEKLTEACSKLGIPITKEDYLWEVAARLKGKQ